MIRKFLAGLLTYLFLMGMSGIAQALLLEDVGEIDDLLAHASLGDSGDPTELAWVNTILGGDPEYVYDIKYDTPDGAGWEAITDADDGVFAHALVVSPEYYLIKIGENSGAGSTHFLFENLISLNWAVIDLGEMGFNDENILNIGKVSHIGELGGTPVPEPATMLLFGTGLIGLAGLRLRKKNK